MPDYWAGVGHHGYQRTQTVSPGCGVQSPDAVATTPAQRLGVLLRSLHPAERNGYSRSTLLMQAQWGRCPGLDSPVAAEALSGPRLNPAQPRYSHILRHTATLCALR